MTSELSLEMSYLKKDLRSKEKFTFYPLVHLLIRASQLIKLSTDNLTWLLPLISKAFHADGVTKSSVNVATSPNPEMRRYFKKQTLLCSRRLQQGRFLFTFYAEPFLAAFSSLA